MLAVFVDLFKAFDRVWKEGLLLSCFKLMCLKSCTNGSRAIYSTEQQVKLDNTLSQQMKMREGVSQGGVVSPTLFLVYINGLVPSLPRCVSNTLHADDLAIWSSETSAGTATFRIQTAINKVAEWTDKWALSINKTKTVAVLFSLSTSKERIKLTQHGHHTSTTSGNNNISW